MLEFLGSTLDSAPILAPCSIPAPCKAAGDSSSSEVPAPAFCSLSLSQPLRHLNGKPANGSCVSLFLPLCKILYYLSMDLFEGWKERRRDTETELSICWFTSQLTITAMAVASYSQQPETIISHMSNRNPITRNIIHCLPST